ncbi:MAG TPA: hypothetical protein VGJ96_08875 [Gemmatimonadaceae bacterium]|jgi:hypothetical protein
MLTRRSLGAAAFCCASATLSAQQPAGTAAPQPAAQQPAAPTGPSPLVTLRSTLRQLVTSQEAYFADHGTYATDLAALKAAGFRSPTKATLTLLESKATGWSASATHAGVAGATCVIWVGRPSDVKPPKTAREGRAGREGEPTCDEAMAAVENQQIAEMKSALRNLVVAEEKHWAEHGTYTTDGSLLGLYPPPKGTRPAFAPQVIFAGSRGWSGIVVHRRLGKSCVIYVGSPDELPFVPRTERERVVASREGEPACERP